MEKYIAGIDEAGRGPLAGPVSVSAVIMTLDNYSKIRANIKSLKWIAKNRIPLLRDSKKLSEKQREQWYEQICLWKKEGILDFSNSLSSPEVIDRDGISVVIKKSVNQVLRKFKNINDDSINILLDGSLFAPDSFTNQKTIIKGDESEPIISLASIVSKVKRDRKITELAKIYPNYQFEINKGYGTAKHMNLIKKHGLSKIHRKTFCTKLLS